MLNYSVAELRIYIERSEDYEMREKFNGIIFLWCIVCLLLDFMYLCHKYS